MSAARPDSNVSNPLGDTNHVSSANYCSHLVIDLKRRKRAKSQPSEPPRIGRLLEQAEQWQRLLDSGDVRSRAELARREGVSAMRVTNLLALRKLHPAILDAIRALPSGMPDRLVTEMLRSNKRTGGWANRGTQCC